MVVPAIIGIVLLAIVGYVSFRVLQNVFLGFVLVGITFVASLLIFGSFPSFRQIPVIGGLFPQIPGSVGDFIVAVRNIFYHIDILGVSRDSDNDLLVAVINSGKLSLSNFNVSVDNHTVQIMNKIDNPLPSGKTAVIEVNWKNDFSQIVVSTKNAEATFKKV